MSKALYAGIDSLARKVKKMYIGIEGVARKVKKAYIGVNGIARLFFAGGAPVYAGRTQDEEELGAAGLCAPVGPYGLWPTVSASIFKSSAIYYDAELTRGEADSVDHGNGGAAAWNKDGAFFAGGGNGVSGSTAYDTVHWYDGDLEHSSCPDLPTGSRLMAATSNNGKAYFVGGTKDQGSSADTALDQAITYAFGDNTQETLPAFHHKSAYCTGAATGEYAVIFGGQIPGSNNTDLWCGAYDADGTLVDLDIDFATGNYPSRIYAKGVSFANRAVFAGGECPATGDDTDEVVAYDPDLTRQMLPALTVQVSRTAGGTLGDQVLFGGGNKVQTSGEYTSVDGYTDTFTKVQYGEVLADSYMPTATTVDDQLLLFAANRSTDIDYFKLE